MFSQRESVHFGLDILVTEGKRSTPAEYAADHDEETLPLTPDSRGGQAEKAHRISSRRTRRPGVDVYGSVCGIHKGLHWS